MSKLRCTTHNGNINWILEDDVSGERKLHREDGPAIIESNGSDHWFCNGVRHRSDGPAISLTGEDNQGYRVLTRSEWWLNGKLHRVDGPAVINADGSKEWWYFGLRHRIGGPAVIDKDGNECWIVNNRLHRTDGPARIVYVNNIRVEHWYINNKQVQNVDEWLIENKITWPLTTEYELEFKLRFL